MLRATYGEQPDVLTSKRARALDIVQAQLSLKHCLHPGENRTEGANVKRTKILSARSSPVKQAFSGRSEAGKRI